MAKLVSVNVGMPQDVPWRGRTVHTGVWKNPVSGPRMVRRLNIDGDGQGDLAGHGGEQRAVLVYQLESYRYWQEFLGRDDLEYGAFGENLTVDGLSDHEVWIGDRFQVGAAEFEVTQPRVTCFRVGLRLGEPRLPSLLVAHRRPGFYLRVITEGHIAPGDTIVRTRRGPHGLSVAEVDGLLYLPDPDATRLRDAIDVPALSPGWHGSFVTMLEGEHERAAPAGVPVTAPPAWTGFRSLTVADVIAESDAVNSYVLAADEALPGFEAGQFVTVRLPAAAGDPIPVRSYSLSGGADGGRYRISVKQESDGRASNYLRSYVARGDLIDVAAPRGDFVLNTGTDPVLLISAGIGVTPVLAMLHQLAASQDTRDVWWIHTTRDASTHAFADEAAGLLARLPSSHSVIYYTSSRAPATAGISTGRLTTEALTALGLPVAADAFVCGPESFMDDVSSSLASVGLDAGRIHTERFGSRSPVNPGVVRVATSAPHLPPGGPGDGPLVTFARSGITAPWSTEYPSVLEFAEACDVPTQWSCRAGVCHTCVTPILSGQASYTTPPLDAPGNDELLICVAQPTTDLVVDL
jgi:ferredoxin-NADP reductase/MOSC domain-containing protein YiiM